MKKKRIQFDLDESTLKELDELVVNNGSSTRAEVIRKALKLYSVCNEAINEGKNVVLKGNGEETLLLII